MTEFWEQSFQEKGAMWGNSPALSAQRAASSFCARGHADVLIPGIGYGRNAKPFLDAGLSVTGIEISPTAIEMLKRAYGTRIHVHHGSVVDMPFGQKSFDSIFSFAVLHLLDQSQRQQFIEATYAQLKPGGTAVFVTIADTAPMFGTGTRLADRLYETRPGVRLYFYEESSICEDSGDFGLASVSPITEPGDSAGPALDFLWIECHRALRPAPGLK